VAHRTLTLAVGLSATAALAACSNSGETAHATAPAVTAKAVGVQISQDVATVLASEVGAVVADYQQSEQDLGLAGNLPPGVVPNNSACPTDSIGRTRTFPSKDPTDTISYLRTWQFLSRAGCERHYVADSTNRVITTSVFSGDFNDIENDWDHDEWHGRHRGMRTDTVAGTPQPGTNLLLSTSPTHVWNGSAASFDSVFFKDSHQQRMHRWQAYDTTANVSIANPGPVNCNYPLSGTWTRWLSDTLQASGSDAVSKIYHLHLVMTFSTDAQGHGSKFATLQTYNLSMIGNPVTTCMVDLWTGTIVGGSCH